MTAPSDRTDDAGSPLLFGRPGPRSTGDLRIESDGRFAGPAAAVPPDPRAVIEDLRRRLRAEQEKSLNSVDEVMGARAAAAQAKAETQEIFYRLHVRETELEQMKELMAGVADSPVRGAGGLPSGAERSADRELSGNEPPSPATAARALLSAIRRAVAGR